MQLDKIFLSLGLAKNVAELVTLLLVLLVLSGIFWLLIGRFRLNSFLINIYISYALLVTLPKDFMTFNKNSYILLFLIFLVILTLMNKYLFDIHNGSSGLAVWQVFVMSFFEVVLVLSIVLTFLAPKDILLYMSKDSLTYFIGPWWRVAWIALPLLFLIFVKKRDR